MSAIFSTEYSFVYATFESENPYNQWSTKSAVDKEVRLGQNLIKLHHALEPIPVTDAIVITVIVILLIIISNLLVLIYYRKSKTSNRPYVLALVVLDFVSILFVPPMELIFMYKHDAAYINFANIRLEIVNWVYLFYLVPSFFLAVDRFMAVFFPHKFKLWLKKIRNFKIVAFVVYCGFVLGFRVTYLIDSDLTIVFSATVSFCLFIVIVLGSFAMYIAMYVNLIRTAKSMKAMQMAGNNGNIINR